MGLAFSLICMQTEQNQAEWSYCQNNWLDYCWEFPQRLGSQLNRNAMICDLHQTGIYKKVLRKGSF